MTNLEIAKLLRAVAAAYLINPDPKGINRFRLIAYNNAADAVEHSTSELKDLWDDKKIDAVPGIGTGIAASLDELFRTGTVKHYEGLFEGLPEAMFELLEIPGIGAKTAYKLTRELGITKAHGALEKLQKAAEKGRIREIEGFGAQSEKEIIEAITETKARSKRLLLPQATLIAEEIIAWMKGAPDIKSIDPLGSLRRRASTVGDIDIAVGSNYPKEVIAHFTKYPKKVKIIEAGIASATLLLPGAVHVDLMVQPTKAYGALLQHFTGSKHHNVALRTYAVKKGLSLSEQGIKKKMENGKWKMENCATEEVFYKALGMDWIPPELRENEGEIEAALKHKLPYLVKIEDIKGDLHMHSNFPQETSHDIGVHTMAEMVEYASNLGYEYIGFTEHNPKSTLPLNEILDVLKEKQERVNMINESIKKKAKSIAQTKTLTRIFNGLEIDIQSDGKLSLPEKGFDYLDYAIVSLHSSFRGTKANQTKRVLEGLAHPKVRIFGHPTGRKINRREGVDLEWEKMFEYCKTNNKWLEINSSPDRLDLPDVLVREAVEKGIKLIINTDAHEKNWLSGMRYGVSVARRGWAQKEDIVNCQSLESFRKFLANI